MIRISKLKQMVRAVGTTGAVMVLFAGYTLAQSATVAAAQPSGGLGFMKVNADGTMTPTDPACGDDGDIYFYNDPGYYVRGNGTGNAMTISNVGNDSQYIVSCLDGGVKFHPTTNTATASRKPTLVTTARSLRLPAILISPGRCGIWVVVTGPTGTTIGMAPLFTPTQKLTASKSGSKPVSCPRAPGPIGVGHNQLIRICPLL